MSAWLRRFLVEMCSRNVDKGLGKGCGAWPRFFTPRILRPLRRHHPFAPFIGKGGSGGLINLSNRLRVSPALSRRLRNSLPAEAQAAHLPTRICQKPSKPVDDRRRADRQGFHGETSPWSQGAAGAAPEKGRQGAQLPLEGGNAKRVPPPKRFRG